jgi:energy-coupling factor transporter ATP-binding protein EcfA2
MTGRALFGPKGEAYDEVIGAEVLLGYIRQQLPGSCPVISHPMGGSRVYPATLFTSAPLSLLRAAIDAAASSSSSGGGGAHVSHAEAPAQQRRPHEPIQPPPPGAGPAWGWPAPPLLTIKGLDLPTPDGTPIVRGLSLQLPTGSSLLISGPAGAGKSTLLRALAGLRRAAGGAATLPAPSRTLFLPQRPIAAPPGANLRQQLAYPWGAEWEWSSDSKAAIQAHQDRRSHAHAHAAIAHAAAAPCDAGTHRMLSALDAVGLSSLLTRTGGLEVRPAPPCGSAGPVSDWAAGLSPGELQRLAFARALMAAPALVFLDEPTSALGEAEEARLFGLLSGAGATIVTVGHRRSLAAHHRLELRIAGDGMGAWQLGPTAGAGAAPPSACAVAQPVATVLD